jgi:hypothetical protein
VKRIPYGPEEDAIIRALFPDNHARDIAALIDRSEASVDNRAFKLGVRKSNGYKVSKGGRFLPGHSPHNAGRRGVTGVQEGCRATQFKPGRPAHEARNYQPIGSLRVTKDGYLERKVTDDHPVPTRRWTAVHRLVWEEVNGPVPPGHIVVFKPGCRTIEVEQITPDRLECITRAENCRRNSFWNNYPPEVARLVQLRGALNRKINNWSKQREEQGQ